MVFFLNVIILNDNNESESRILIRKKSPGLRRKKSKPYSKDCIDNIYINGRPPKMFKPHQDCQWFEYDL